MIDSGEFGPQAENRNFQQNEVLRHFFVPEFNETYPTVSKRLMRGIERGQSDSTEQYFQTTAEGIY